MYKLLLWICWSLLYLLHLVHLAEYLFEVLVHEVRVLYAAVVLLYILQEAEEDGVHRHRVDGEEDGGYGVGGEDDDEYGHHLVVELLPQRPRLRPKHPDRRGQHQPNHDHFTDEENEICHFIQDDDPDHIAAEEGEGSSSSGAEIVPVDRGHDVRVPVDELDEVLQTVEAALAQT